MNINKLNQSMYEIKQHNDQTKRNKHLLMEVTLNVEVLMDGSL